MAHVETWSTLRSQALALHRREPVLRGLLMRVVLQAASLEASLAQLLSAKLRTADVDADTLAATITAVCAATPSLGVAVCRDLAAIVERDPCTRTLLQAFLFHKGFHALQVHRVGHSLWLSDRPELARFLQNRMSDAFAVDIHPAARIGMGVFIDHATGVVIGETAHVGDDVTMLQDVTLGGTGKERGDRHPKVGDRALLCAGAKVLGNVRIGADARVGAGSVVLDDVPAQATVVGVPARVVRRDSNYPNPPATPTRVRCPETASSLENLA